MAMASPPLRLLTRRRGPRRGGALLALGLVAAAAGACSLSRTSCFAFGAVGRASAPRPAAATGRASRLTRAARGGEAAEGSVAKGDHVRAVSAEDGGLYPGTVMEAKADGRFVVRWDDPDGGPETEEVQLADVRPFFKGYQVNDIVEAVFPDDGNMYPGTVMAVNKDGTFQVKWDDPDGGPEDSAVRPGDMKYPPIPLDKLEIGKKYKGTVQTVREFGAFVDIGAEKDGLVHISRIAQNTRITNIDDYLQEGQEIDVWVTGTADDRLGLSMFEGAGGPAPKADLTPFADVSADEWFSGTVRNVAPFGAFVTVTLPEGGGQADGLVHISQLRDGFVESVQDEVEVGQEVQVRVISVDTERNKMSLSMKQSGGGFRAPQEPADLSAFEGTSPDTWLSGKVARTAPFGAFVTVTAKGGEQADGLVHITQLKDGFVESVEDEVEIDQEVQVRVLSVENGKMSLSMKAAEEY